MYHDNINYFYINRFVNSNHGYGGMYCKYWY